MKINYTRNSFISTSKLLLRFGRFFCLSMAVCLLPTEPSSAQSSTAYTWKNVQISGGGFVSGIVYSPAQQNLIYARTDVGGAYRWNSSNSTWTPLSDFIGSSASNDMGVLSIAADPNDANRIYMATGMYTQSWAGTGAVYASTDKGTTWTRSSLSIKLGGNEDGRSTGERLQVDPNLGSVLFLGSSTDGLWKSTNYGSTWSKVTSFPVSTSAIGSGGIAFVQFDKTSSSSGTATKTIYAGVLQSGTNLYKSTDGGTTWAAVSGQPSGNMPHHAALLNNTMYITYSNGPGPNSVTAGAFWKLNTSTNQWTQLNPPSGQGGYAGISVASNNANIVVVSTMDRWYPKDEIYRSTDGGNTWTALLTGAIYSHTLAPYAASSTPHWIGDVDIDPFNANSAWFITGYGVYNSGNITASPVTWSFLNKGLEETVPLGLISPGSGAPLLSAIGDIDGFRHDNLDASPTAGRLAPLYGTNTSIDFAENTPAFMARTFNNSSGNYGAYSTNGGTNWTAFATFPAGTTGGGNIAVAANAGRIVWCPQGASSAYYSTNNGNSWTSSSGLPAGLKPVADRVNSNKFYAYDSANGKIYGSTDGGATFSVKSSGLPTVPSYQSGDANLRAVFGIEGEIWMTSPGAFYKSVNSGVSYTQVTSVNNVSKVGFGKAAVGQTHPAIYIIGNVNNTYGFYRSTDSGASWTRINDATHQFGSINDIIGDPRTYSRVYLATGGRGILYGTSTSGARLGEEDKEFTAEQSIIIAPNPNKGVFSIELPGFNPNIDVQISISDLTGKNVHLQMSPYTPKIQVNASLTAGLYLVQVSNGINTAVKKVIISE